MTAPFEIGDRVVRVAPIKGYSPMKVGDIFTVKEIWYCCPRMGYRMTLVEVESPGEAMIHKYGAIYCGPIGDFERSHPITDVAGWPCILFALLSDSSATSDHTVESLLKELSEPVRELQPA